MGNFIASPMLERAPSLANGDVTAYPFTVTFRISERAVWEDGRPITSHDFWFTWRAIVSTPGAYRTAGYDLIESINSTDPKTVVIRFRDLYVNWPELFGGVSGFLLKAAAFPAFAADDHPDLRGEMLARIPFSGGPYFLESWSRDQALLIRNGNYFGPRARIQKITFVPRTDPALEIQSVMSGEISAIYPEPRATTLLDSCCEGPEPKGGDGQGFELLWLDVRTPPLDQPLVRQALLFSIDRQRVVDQMIRLNNPLAEVLNCGFVSQQNLGQWCRDRPFERYAYDPAKARSLLEEAGYDCSASPCEKDGKSLRIAYRVFAGNARRLQTQKILIQGAKAGGFDLVARTFEPPLFEDATHACAAIGPIGECTLAPSPNAGVTDLFACDAIRSADNDFAGLNFTHWCNPQADLLMKAADRALDPRIRLDLMSEVYELQAEDAIGLPLYVIPAVTVWRSDKIEGPIGLWNGTPYGTFFNMDEWSIVGS